MSSVAAAAVWELVIVHCEVYEDEGIKTCVINGLSFTCKKNNIEHQVTIKIKKLPSMEEVTKEDIIFRYGNNYNYEKEKIRGLRYKNKPYHVFKILLESYELPDLTHFNITDPQPYLLKFNLLSKSPEERETGLIYKTLEGDIMPDLNEMAHYIMEIYKSCVVEHKFVNALSGDDDCL